jgi:hypothetical protein
MVTTLCLICEEPVEAGSPLGYGLCRECQETQEDGVLVRRQQERARAMNAAEMYGNEEVANGLECER